jgi:hypothetical protein
MLGILFGAWVQFIVRLVAFYVSESFQLAAALLGPSAQTFRDFLSTIILRPHLQHLPEPLRTAFLDAMIEPPYEIDYVRLNLQARKR